MSAWSRSGRSNVVDNHGRLHTRRTPLDTRELSARSHVYAYRRADNFRAQFELSARPHVYAYRRADKSAGEARTSRRGGGGARQTVSVTTTNADEVLAGLARRAAEPAHSPAGAAGQQPAAAP